MANLFDDNGVRFRYPENWQLERQDEENGWTVSLQSPGTAFLMISVREDMPTTEEMADEVLQTMRQEYPKMEVEDRVDTLAGQMAVGHDIHFIALDLTNSCWTRSFYCDAGTVLVLCQSNDLELETSEPVLRAICASLEVDAE
jgi:hypothetical protein